MNNIQDNKLTGQTVIHKKYGIGQITKIIDNHTYIKYPSCFENGFLKLKLQHKMITQIAYLMWR